MRYDFEPTAYVHKLKAQELGYRKEEPGGGGRYIYISKRHLDFFPPLSEVVLNDHVLIDVMPPFSDDIVLTNYVYHNDKFAVDRTRDEYRLYLNSKIDPERKFYEPDDIIVLIKIYYTDPEADSPVRDIIYKLFRFSLSDRHYEKLNNLLEGGDPRYASHALISLQELTFLDELRRIKLGKKVIPLEVIEEALSEPVVHKVEPEEEQTRIMRSRSFRDLILYFYDYQCAVTGKDFVIEHNDFINLEAAHICARAAGGGSHPSNGMALERNLHWAYDKGFFTITENYEIKVHPDAMGITYLKTKHKSGIIEPEDSRSKPDKEALKWHKDNVYGIFLNSIADN